MTWSNRLKSEDMFMLMVWMVMSGLYAIFLGKDVCFDMRNYHAYNPFALFHGRLDIDISPSGSQTYLNPLLDIPFYVLMRSAPPMLTGFLLGAIQGVNGWLATLIIRRAINHRSTRIALVLGRIVGLVGYAGAMNQSEIGTIFGDNIVSIFVLIALLYISPYRDWQKGGCADWKDLRSAGLLVGAAAGLKMTMAIYCIGLLGAVTLTASSKWPDRTKQLLMVCVAMIIGILLTGGYWMALMYLNFHNPLFPFYNGLFRSEYLDAVNIFDRRFLPRDHFQTFLYPFYFIRKNVLVSELAFRDIRLAVTFTLIVLSAVPYFCRLRKAAAVTSCTSGGGRSPAPHERYVLFLTLFFALSYVVWQFQFSIYRYLIPLEFFSIILIILLLDRMFFSDYTFMCLSVGLLVVIALTVSSPNWGRAEWTRDEYVAVTYDQEVNLERAVVLMGDNPFAYLIPYFPQSAAFIKLDHVIIPQSKAFRQKIRDLLAKPNRPLYVLSLQKNLMDFGMVLREYGVTIFDDQCSPIFATGMRQPFVLCPAGCGVVAEIKSGKFRQTVK